MSYIKVSFFDRNETEIYYCMNEIQILGLIAACFTTFAFLPQALQTIRTRNTNGISLMMYSALIIGIMLWFIYGLLIRDWAIIFANGITFIFASTIWWIRLKNGSEVKS